MDISLFDYELPPELIAQFPSLRRDQSRLLLLDRATEELRHLKFGDFALFPKAGDALVVNNTRVFKARLWGRRKTGGKIEVFLVRKVDPASEVWEALVSPSRRLNDGERIIFDDRHSAELVAPLGSGRWRVRFDSERERKRIIETFGHVPLPHYIGRSDQPSDIERYQTLFSSRQKTGAVAAPTAGFHFTKELLGRLAAQGVELIELTLHVGPGTFKPVKCDNIYDHVVDPEYAELGVEAAEAINRVRQRGGALWVVGTTSVRTLESAELVDGKVRPFGRLVDTYIKPGHRFQLVDHLITNFHLPKSSLLILVSAFAGRELVLESYREAIAQQYRFYSYGDAMLIT
jgi:S-adenosylmethionine:tRNA ribosyltransferase-isomerase